MQQDIIQMMNQMKTLHNIHIPILLIKTILIIIINKLVLNKTTKHHLIINIIHKIKILLHHKQ